LTSVLEFELESTLLCYNPRHADTVYVHFLSFMRKVGSRSDLLRVRWLQFDSWHGKFLLFPLATRTRNQPFSSPVGTGKYWYLPEHWPSLRSSGYSVGNVSSPLYSVHSIFLGSGSQQ
jgi:hypothetical protein